MYTYMYKCSYMHVCMYICTRHKAKKNPDLKHETVYIRVYRFLNIYIIYFIYTWTIQFWLANNVTFVALCVWLCACVCVCFCVCVMQMSMTKWHHTGQQNEGNRFKKRLSLALTCTFCSARRSELLRSLAVVPGSVHTILIIAGALRAIVVVRVVAVAQRATLLCGCCLFGGRHIDGCDQVIPTARLEGRRAFILVVAATPRSGSGEDQVVYGARIATSRRLSSRVQSLILPQLIHTHIICMFIVC